MGVIWGDFIEEQERLTRGLGMRSSLMYFLRSLGARRRARVRS
jgi:hypothetical protein